jgi:hypothetical protein
MPDLDRVIGQQFHRLAREELPVPPVQAVIRRGRQRRRRTRDGAISAVAVAAAVVTVVAVSQLAGSPAARHATPAGHGHRGGPSHAQACTAVLSASLRAALSAPTLPISDQQNVSPIALSSDGTALWVLTTTQGFHGVAEESLHTGAILQRIMPLGSNYLSASGGPAPDGGVLWTSTYTHGESGGMHPVQLYQAANRRVSEFGPQGPVLSVPVYDSPADKLAAWEVADGPQQEIVEANLDTAVAHVVARGYLGPPVFVGNTLVWSTARNSDGLQTRLAAANATSFPAVQSASVPPAVRAASDAVATRSGYGPTLIPAYGLIASYGGATAYFSAGLTKLYYSPAPSQPAHLLLTLPGGDTVSPGSVFAGPGYIGWGTAAAKDYLMSTSSFAIVQVINGTSWWGEVQGLGRDVLVGTFRPTKKQHLTQYRLVSGSVISKLTCARR